MDIKSNSGKGSKKKKKREKTWTKSLHLFKSYLNNEQNIGRNMDIYRLFHEVSDGNEKHVIGKGMKNDPCNKVKKRIG